MDKYIGRLLDNRYEILESIGTGGMAVVYKARCHRLNRLVAIKILKDDYLQDEEFRRRFHSESQAVAMLSHPNIVSVYDVSTSIMADYIVMELIEGITLKQYMEKKGVLNWKETLHFAIQIAKALEHAHSKGIVHRDIKPHNVMVLKNGSVKVMDFGIARMMSKGNTLTKEALGSVHYISPEQAKGGRVDSRSDIYSLGVVMYEMMAGRPPYDGDSPVSVAIQHINGGAVLPSTLNPNIPGGLEQIIMKAMAHEIGDRYVSATRMLSDMDEFRKNPSLLFDYNTPPLDAVTKMPPPLILQPKPPTQNPVQDPVPNPPQSGASVAERTANRANPPQRRTAATNSSEARRIAREREERRRQQQAAESSSRVATIAIIICSIVAVIAIAIFVVLFVKDGIQRNEDLITVPDLVGQDYEQLQSIDGLQIKKTEEHHDTVPKGEIISQKPKSGEAVVSGTTVVVTVSKGPGEGTMIDYSLMTAEDAKARLDSLELGLVIDTQEEYNGDVPEGQVIRTNPAVNGKLTVGQKVTLYVSKGPGDGTMPDVVGKTQENAEDILEKQKLDLVIVPEAIFDSEVEEGKVIRSEPAVSEQLKAGQTVTLYVSKGPEMKSMPNVEGMSIDVAVNVLVGAGFKTPQIEYVESNEAKDTVVKQSHEKNVEIDVNTTIVLEISKGAASVTKTVTIPLGSAASAGECTVKIMRDGVVLYEGTVAQGTTSITLENQTGSGAVTYDVIINNIDGTYTENF